MITEQRCYEDFSYIVKLNHGHLVNTDYNCIYSYKEPDTFFGEWLECPCCGLKPKVWEFNNGRSTACGCGTSRYDHFSVHSESIMSVVSRCNGSVMDFETDDLRKNWNEYCMTMINPCSEGDLYFEEKW